MRRFPLLTLRDPFHVLLELEQVFATPARAAESSARRLDPPVRVVRHEDGYLVRSELPGFSAEDLALESHGQTLRLQGRRTLEQSPEGAHTAEFTRAIELPEDAALGEASATLRHGVLTLRVPLKPAARPRQVPITSA
jgi:HSP20 family molecular chaperone IbpA